jgi:hypothetical protein
MTGWSGTPHAVPSAEERTYASVTGGFLGATIWPGTTVGRVAREEPGVGLQGKEHRH